MQELRVTRTSSRMGRPTTVDEDIHNGRHSPCEAKETPTYSNSQQNASEPLLHPLVVQFTIVLQV